MLKRWLLMIVCSLPMVTAVPALAVENSGGIDASSPKKGLLAIENNTGKACTFIVYSITGQVVRKVETDVRNVELNLPQGFYIVKSELGTKKVVVK